MWFQQLCKALSYTTDIEKCCLFTKCFLIPLHIIKYNSVSLILFHTQKYIDLRVTKATTQIPTVSLSPLLSEPFVGSTH